MQKGTILVVEDFVAVQQFLRETLESKGYKTLGATNGNNAYEILANHPQKISLVITDYHMPDSTGLDLIVRMRQNVNLKYLPVIFLTTERNELIIGEAAKAGFSAWITKPYRAEVLLREIEKAMSVL